MEKNKPNATRADSPRFRFAMPKRMKRLRSDVSTIWFIYGRYIDFAWAFFLLAGGILGSFLPVWANWTFVVIGAALAASSLIPKITRIVAVVRGTPFTRRADDHPTAAQPQWTRATGQQYSTVYSPSEASVDFWHDPDVDATLVDIAESQEFWRSRPSRSASGPDRPPVEVSARVRENAYGLPRRLAELAPLAFWATGKRLDAGSVISIRERFHRRPERFNGRMMRLATELTADQLRRGSVQLQRVRFFDGECSNELWAYSLQGAQGPSIIEPYVLDRDGRISALQDSNVANILGITVVAITADDKIVMVRQGIQNSVAGASWAVGGSGSVEQRDLSDYLDAKASQIRESEGELSPKARRLRSKLSADHHLDFFALLLTTVRRLLKDEASVDPETIVDSSFRVTAYSRWAQRGYKPEISAFIALTATADELYSQFAEDKEGRSELMCFVPMPKCAQDLSIDDIAGALAEADRQVDGGDSSSGSVVVSPEVGTTGPCRPRVRINPSSEFTLIAAQRMLKIQDSLKHGVPTSILFDEALREIVEADPPVIRTRERYRVPKQLQDESRPVVEDIMSRPGSFNGAMVGLRHAGGSSGEVPAEVSIARYSDYLASDYFAGYRRQCFSSLIVDDSGRLLPPDQSPLLHAIGVTFLGISEDGGIITVRQTADNDFNTGEVGAMGSGSLDPKDIVPGSLMRTLRTGALREASEESGIDLASFSEPVFLGAARWLDKGGKPEFYFAGAVRVHSFDLAGIGAVGRERTFSQELSCVKSIRPRSQWHDCQTLGTQFALSRMLGGWGDGRLSAPLTTSLLMVLRDGNRDGPLGALLDRYPQW